MLAVFCQGSRAGRQLLFMAADSSMQVRLA